MNDLSALKSPKLQNVKTKDTAMGTVSRIRSTENNCRRDKDHSNKRNKKEKSREKLLMRTPERSIKSKAHIQTPTRKISNYFTPSPRESDLNLSTSDLPNPTVVPPAIIKSSIKSEGNGNSCRSNISPNTNCSNRKKKAKADIDRSNVRRISNYFTPSPEKYGGKLFSPDLPTQKRVSTVTVKSSISSKNSGKNSKSNSIKRSNSPKRKRKPKICIESSKLRKISNLFSPIPKKSGTSSPSNKEDDLPRIKKLKKVSEKENPTDKGSKVSSSYQKYGICMPSYEDILQEQRNYENHKKIIQNLTELVTPLPDIGKFQIDNEVHQPDVLDCKAMSDEKLLSAFKSNLKYLDDIYYENTSCKRHDLYKKATGSDLTYNTSMILFTNEQKQILASKLSKRYGKSSLSHDYYFKVLLPELCLKIFMDEFSVTFAEATSYLDERPVEI